MKTSDSIKEIATALSLAQGEFTPAPRDGLNLHRKNKFATLTGYLEGTRPIRSKYGLSVFQTLEQTESGVILITLLMHNSGEYIQAEMPVTLDKNNHMQDIGSAQSYARRYALAAALGLSQEDDDGEKAIGNANSKALELDDKGKPKSKPPSPGPKPSKPQAPPPVPAMAPIKAILARDKILISFNKFGVSKKDIEARYQKDIDRLEEHELAELVEIGKRMAKGEAKAQFFGEPKASAPPAVSRIESQRLKKLIASIPHQPEASTDGHAPFDFEEFDPNRKDDTT